MKFSHGIYFGQDGSNSSPGSANDSNSGSVSESVSISNSNLIPYDTPNEAKYYAQRDPGWIDIDSMISENDRTDGKVVMLSLVPPQGILYDIKVKGVISSSTGSSGNGKFKKFIKYDDVDPATTLASGERQIVLTITRNSNNDYIKNLKINEGFATNNIVELITIGALGGSLGLRDVYQLDRLKIIGDNTITSLTVNDSLKYLSADLNNIEMMNFTFSNLYADINDFDLKINLNKLRSMTYFIQYAKNTKEIKSDMFYGTPTKKISAGKAFRGTRIEKMELPFTHKISKYHEFVKDVKTIYELPEMDMSSAEESPISLDTYAYVTHVKNCNNDIIISGKNIFLTEIIRTGLYGIVDRTGESESRKLTIGYSKANFEYNNMTDTDIYPFEGTDYTKQDIEDIFTNKNWVLEAE